MNILALITQGDAVTGLVAALLLLMSVASWVVIVWKAWLLRRARGDVARSTAVFWQSSAIKDAQQKVAAFDRESLVLPLIAATGAQAPGTLASAGDRSQQLTRLLRDALHGVLHRLHYGQVLLATVGSTAPFVGLLGTVWGIYHALVGIAAAGQITIDKVSGPVGEALIMTAAGLAVAIPAVLAYNIFGRNISRIEADLEGFAYDLRELLAATGAVAGQQFSDGPPLGKLAPPGGSAVHAVTSVGAP
ncbi:MAG: MotA/TolQ/ExbB proton channel family protein [Pseudomonadota bacterium]|nr:MotA/TolQ/ExbB proton channel family protein [Pseudomonadota bacterium]